MLVTAPKGLGTIYKHTAYLGGKEEEAASLCTQVSSDKGLSVTNLYVVNKQTERINKRNERDGYSTSPLNEYILFVQFPMAIVIAKQYP